jgi:polysaccharide pyruvyl transferase WcaK-like protein
MTKILFIGISFVNKGSGAMLISTSQTLKQFIPDAVFTMTSRNPEIDFEQCKKYGVKVVGIKQQDKEKRPFLFRLFRFGLCYTFYSLRFVLWAVLFKSGLNINKLMSEKMRAFAEADIVMDLSGISFTDYFGTMNPIEHSYNILLCLILKKPIVKYSQAMGPFESRLNIFLAKTFLPRVDLLVARGEITKKYLREMGITKQIYVLADSAFLLQPAPLKRVEEIFADEGINKDGAEHFIGISVNYHLYKWCKFSDTENMYVILMAKIADYLVENLNAKVVFIPHDISPSGRDDRFVIEKICQIIKNKHKICAIKGDYDPMEFKGIIGQLDLFLGARFHSIIASTSMHVPTVVIAWSHKYYEVMKMLGQEKYVCDYKTVTFDELVSKIKGIAVNKEEIKNELKIKTEVAKKSAMRNAKLVKELVDSLNLKTSPK